MHLGELQLGGMFHWRCLAARCTFVPHAKESFILAEVPVNLRGHLKPSSVYCSTQSPLALGAALPARKKTPRRLKVMVTFDNIAGLIFLKCLK